MMESRSDSMDALNFAKGFGAAGLASTTGARLVAAATRGYGRCALADAAPATSSASAPVRPGRTRDARRRRDVTESEVIREWTRHRREACRNCCARHPWAHSA